MDDAKNYHAWAHRQWVLTTCAGDARHITPSDTLMLYLGEMDFANAMIGVDVRNNSAWSQRFFARKWLVGRGNDLHKSQANELRWALGYVARDASNESAWKYAHALLRWSQSAELSQLREMLLNACEAAIQATGDCIPASVVKERLNHGLGDADDGHAWRQLATRDPIRAKYWNLQASRVVQKATPNASLFF